MEISTERKGNVLVVTTEERIDGINARAFQDALQATIDDDDRVVILDLRHLTYISSAGLRVILLVARTLQRQDGNLAVCSLSGPVLEGLSDQRLRPDHPDLRLPGRSGLRAYELIE